MKKLVKEEMKLLHIPGDSQQNTARSCLPAGRYLHLRICKEYSEDDPEVPPGDAHMEKKR